MKININLETEQEKTQFLSFLKSLKSNNNKPVKTKTKTYHFWTKEEDLFLKKNLDKKPSELQRFIIGASTPAISTRKHRLRKELEAEQKNLFNVDLIETKEENSFSF